MKSEEANSPSLFPSFFFNCEFYVLNGRLELSKGGGSAAGRKRAIQIRRNMKRTRFECRHGRKDFPYDYVNPVRHISMPLFLYV